MKYKAHSPTFVPTTAQEIQSLGWRQLDVILITGDAYIDAPHIGVAVIGRVLMNAGYRERPGHHKAGGTCPFLRCHRQHVRH